MHYSARESPCLYIIALSCILSLHFHENSPKFWSTQLLNILQSFLLVKVLSLDCSESYTLSTNEPNIYISPQTIFYA